MMAGLGLTGNARGPSGMICLGGGQSPERVAPSADFIRPGVRWRQAVQRFLSAPPHEPIPRPSSGKHRRK